MKSRNTSGNRPSVPADAGEKSGRWQLFVGVLIAIGCLVTAGFAEPRNRFRLNA
jgi:hypothetical protein